MIRFLAVMILVLGIFSCAKKENPGDAVSVNKLNEVININDIKQLISNLPAQAKKRFSTPKGEKYFYNEYLRYILFDAKAKDVGLKKIEKNNYLVGKRILYNSSALYFATLKRNGGIQLSELNNYYNKNVNKYVDNKGNKISFSKIQTKVLFDYLDSKGLLETYYKNHKKEFVEPARLSLSMIFSKSKKQILKAQKMLKKNSFQFVAKNYSEDSITSKRNGRLGLYIEGTAVAGISKSDSLFGLLLSNKDSISDIFKVKKGYYLFKTDLKKSGFLPKFKNKKQSVLLSYLRHQRIQMDHGYVDSLRKKYNVSIDLKSLHVSDSLLKSYYLKNRAKYVQRKRLIKAIFSDKYSILLEAEKKYKNHVDFDSLYKEYNKDSIVFGMKFKNEFPYPEIGREAYKLLKVGDVSSVFRTDKGYYFIKLLAISDSVYQLPFETIKEDLYHAFILNEMKKMSSTKIFAIGKRSYTYGNYLDEFDQNDQNEMKSYCDTVNIKKMVDFLIPRYLLFNDAEKNEFLNTKICKLFRYYWEKKEWSTILEQQFMNKYYGFTKNQVEQFYLSNKEKLKNIKKDDYRAICSHMLITDDTLKVYYEKNIEKFIKNNELVPLKYVKNVLFKQIVNTKLRAHKLNTYLDMFKEYNVKVLDEKYRPYFMKKKDKLHIAKNIKDSMWTLADTNLVHNRINSAIKIYKQLINTDTEYKVLDSYVHLARLYDGRGQYGRALSIYKYLLSNKKYVTDDVLFLVGFLYYDDLKQPDVAKKYFERLIKDFPKSELVDDAQALLHPNAFLKSIKNK